LIIGNRLVTIDCFRNKELTMTDQWSEQLRCPQCGNIGIASLSQTNDAQMPTVDSVSDGFKTVRTDQL
jgi:cytochrome c-type biogenesis protein CcmH/NrfF